MKRLISLLLCMLMLAGCSKTENNVSLRLMVYAIGIDRTDEGYRVSYQVFSPTGENISKPVNADETNVKVMSVEGKTLYECERAAELRSGKKLFTQDTEAIILGSNVLYDGLFEVVEYFEGAPDVYMGTDIIFSSGDAIDAVSIGLSGEGDPHGYGEIIDEAINQSVAVSSKLAELANSIESSDGSVAVPILFVADSGDGSFYAEGIYESALFANGEYVGNIDADTVKGLRLLSGSAKSLPIVIETRDGNVGAKCVNLKIKRKAYRADNGTPTVTVNISGELVLGDIRKRTDREQMIAAAEIELKRLCEKAYKTAKDYRADLFDIGLLAARYVKDYDDINSGANAVDNSGIEVYISLELY